MKLPHNVNKIRTICPLSSPTNQNYQNNNGISNPSHANPTGVSAKMYKLNGNVASGKLGLGITLKVMAGDVINVFGKSFYINQSGSAPAYNGLPILDLLNGFLNTAGAAMAGSPHGPVTSTAINTPPGTASINSMISQQNSQNTADPLKPRAFINVLFFDEQFRSYQYRISGVGANGQIKDHYSELQNILAAKNGYVYIYCSNESSMDVLFDNVQVTHTRGALLEETHYYPFGLTMAGISSKALNNAPANKYKFNGIEQNNDFDLNTYDAFYRNLDPQIGRFLQVDPVTTHSESPYVAMGNNPVLNKDWLGDYYTWGNQSVHDRYDRMRKENGDKIAGYMKELSGLDINSTDEKVQGQIKELTTLINMHGDLNSQWNEMDASDIEFHVTDEKPTEKGAAGTADYS